MRGLKGGSDSERGTGGLKCNSFCWWLGFPRIGPISHTGSAVLWIEPGHTGVRAPSPVGWRCRNTQALMSFFLFLRPNSSPGTVFRAMCDNFPTSSALVIWKGLYSMLPDGLISLHRFSWLVTQGRQEAARPNLLGNTQAQEEGRT